jgi:hypothetical protein
MSDPTIISLASTFALAFIILFAGFAVLPWIRKRGLTEGREEIGIQTHWILQVDLAVVVGIIGLFALLAAGNVEAAAKDEMKLSVPTLLVTMAMQLVLAGMVLGIAFRRVSLSGWLGLHWPGWPWVFAIGPVGVVGMWAFLLGMQSLGYLEWMQTLGVETMQETVKQLQQAQDPVIIALMAVLAVIVAPVCEEVVFRGYVYPVAKRFAGPVAGTMVCALVFAGAHGSMVALLPLFLLGIVLVQLYERTGSIWAPISLHLCFNAATVLVQLAVRVLDINPEQLAR